jgi:hypothetical protein
MLLELKALACNTYKGKLLLLFFRHEGGGYRRASEWVVEGGEKGIGKALYCVTRALALQSK